jgi:hypothetical protein
MSTARCGPVKVRVWERERCQKTCRSLRDGRQRARVTSFMMSTWSIEMEPEVEEWLASLGTRQFASAASRIDYLSEVGTQIQLPRSRPLGAGLFELRFDVDRTSVDHVLLPGGSTDRLAHGLSEAEAERAC